MILPAAYRLYKKFATFDRKFCNKNYVLQIRRNLNMKDMRLGRISNEMQAGKSAAFRRPKLRYQADIKSFRFLAAFTTLCYSLNLVSENMPAIISATLRTLYASLTRKGDKKRINRYCFDMIIIRFFFIGNILAILYLNKIFLKQVRC